MLKQTQCDVVVSATHVCFGCDVPPCKEKRRKSAYDAAAAQDHAAEREEENN